MTTYGTLRSSPKNGVVMTEKSGRRSTGTTDNRGWFRRALTAIARGGIVVGLLALTVPAASA